MTRNPHGFRTESFLVLLTAMVSRYIAYRFLGKEWINAFLSIYITLMGFYATNTFARRFLKQILRGNVRVDVEGGMIQKFRKTWEAVLIQWRSSSCELAGQTGVPKQAVTGASSTVDDRAVQSTQRGEPQKSDKTWCEAYRETWDFSAGGTMNMARYID